MISFLQIMAKRLAEFIMKKSELNDVEFVFMYVMLIFFSNIEFHCFKHFRPYLQASKRELLADYALPCAVLLLSFIGSFVFRDIPGKNG